MVRSQGRPDKGEFHRRLVRVLVAAAGAALVAGVPANPFTQTVKVHMNNLRRKLNEGFDEQLIETIRGKGYVL